MFDVESSDLGRRRLTFKINYGNSVISCTIESVFMNVNNRKLGLRKRGECLNKLFYSFLSYSFHWPQLALGANKNVSSIYMICEPPIIFTVSFVNSAHTFYVRTTNIYGWAILNNNTASYRIVFNQKIPHLMIDLADVHVLGVMYASVSENFKDMVLRSQLSHYVDTLNWLARLRIRHFILKEIYLLVLDFHF